MMCGCLRRHRSVREAASALYVYGHSQFREIFSDLFVQRHLTLNKQQNERENAQKNHKLTDEVACLN